MVATQLVNERVLANEMAFLMMKMTEFIDGCTTRIEKLSHYKDSKDDIKTIVFDGVILFEPPFKHPWYQGKQDPDSYYILIELARGTFDDKKIEEKFVSKNYYEAFSYKYHSFPDAIWLVGDYVTDKAINKLESLIYKRITKVQPFSYEGLGTMMFDTMFPFMGGAHRGFKTWDYERFQQNCPHLLMPLADKKSVDKSELYQIARDVREQRKANKEGKS